uniref:ATP synthase subunit a n=1 Tax=Aureoumbra lagunensis TaxID=44058 RepID=A0A7U0KSK8_9STRA|nr:ATP synthase F0 subunit 6 [Aureoumbra lagunensis]QQW50416.1 ATP synthase F0 subunit 6 [Aureoumbra lagunensis]
MIKILTSPLEQFQIVPVLPIYVLNFNFSVTNSTLVLLLGICSFFLFLQSIMQKHSFLFFVPRRWQNLVEFFFQMIATLLIKDIVGPHGQKFFPYVLSIFLFILVCNLIGLIPYSFTATSHLIFTFSLAFLIFFGINFVSLRKHGILFFSLFLPSGSSLGLAFILVPIELLSYFVRPVSLSVRLFANMMAGHTLLKVVAGFAWNMMSFGKSFLFVAHFIPLSILVVVMVLEFGVAIIQAYVFTILICIYLNDGLHLH